jgi:hypothetical protein
LVAYLTKWFGEWVIQRLDKAMMAALALAVIAAGAYWLWRQGKIDWSKGKRRRGDARVEGYVDGAQRRSLKWWLN